MEDAVNASRKAPRCPVCGWTDVRLSMPHGLLDRVLHIIGLVPYRCRSCGHRFRRAEQEVQETAE